MDLQKKIKEINQRWNIPEDSTPEEKFKKFKTSIINVFKDIDSNLSSKSIRTFCNVFSIEEVWHKNPYRSYTYSLNVIDALKKENSPTGFYKMIEIIFALDISSSDERIMGEDYGRMRDEYFQQVKDALAFSNIDIAITKKNHDIILYPSGEKLLDEELVNKVLSFISGGTEHHFIEALKFYRQKNPKSRVKSAESLRRALEEFLRFKLKNDKGLKANIPEIGKHLKHKSVNNDIKNLVTDTLTKLDQFFNENSKHKDGNIDKSENEYLIYQVALLLRHLQMVT